jgi:hypothetical protein
MVAGAPGAFGVNVLLRVGQDLFPDLEPALTRPLSTEALIVSVNQPSLESAELTIDILVQVTQCVISLILIIIGQLSIMQTLNCTLSKFIEYRCNSQAK